MKRSTLLLVRATGLALMVVMLVVLMACTPSAAPGKTYSWKLATYRPPAHIIPEQFEVLAQEVNKKSNGQLDIEVFAAGSLLDAKSQFTGVVDGLAELSDTVPGRHHGEVALVNAADLPFSFTDYSMGLKTIRGGLGDLIDKEYAKYGLKALMWYPAGRLDFFTEFPVKTPADFEGKLLRGAGGLQLAFMELCGASTVQMSAGEIYQAMQTGTIDGFLLTDETFMSMKLYEVTSNATLMPLDVAMAVTIMNLDAYNALPSNLQKILNDAARTTEDEIAKRTEASDIESQKAMADQGMEVYQLSKAELAAFKQIGMKTWDSLVTDNPGTSAPEMLDIVKKYCE